jgi:hypothetical protein
MIEWTRQYDFDGDDVGEGLVLDTFGHIYSVGYSSDTGRSGSRVFTQKHDATGIVQWSDYLTTLDYYHEYWIENAYGKDIVIDDSGHFYVSRAPSYNISGERVGVEVTAIDRRGTENGVLRDNKNWGFAENSVYSLVARARVSSMCALRDRVFPNISIPSR